MTGSNRQRTVDDCATSQQRTLWRGNRARVTWDDVERECPSLTASKMRGIPDGHILFFWASSASLIVGDSRLKNWPATKIKDSKGKEVGDVLGFLEDIPFLGRCATAVWKLGLNLLRRLHLEPTSFLGRCVAAIWTVTNYFQHRGPWNPSWATYGPQEFVVIGSETNEYGTALMVLQIYWEDGIAYRVNAGKLNEQAWIEANPTWKLIALM